MSNALEKTHVVAAENNTTLLANLAEHTKVTKVNAEISHLAVECRLCGYFYHDNKAKAYIILIDQIIQC